MQVDPARPTDFRRIVPRETFEVDAESGVILRSYVPDKITFKDPTPGGSSVIRPVAPFLEVFVRTDADPDTLVPLTTGLLGAEGLDLGAVSWTVDVANIKLFRRTGDAQDRIEARLDIVDHSEHVLAGQCRNFREGKTLDLGRVQFIRPSAEFPELRLRYTPASGKVYGSRRERIEKAGQPPVADPVIQSEDQLLYDPDKGGWLGYKESSGPALTNPPQIFAGYSEGDAQVSWGYLDDECDGFATVHLTLADGRVLSTSAHIGAGPPAFAPDTLPPRVVSDELAQILLGPEVVGSVPLDEAEDIVLRALESVRLMNTAVMNGNPVNGRDNVASTMVRQDTNDFGRLYEPIMATSLVDNLAVRALHERVFSALAGVAGPWFADALRRPEEIGDLSDEGRRKMPGLMRNADGRALCLTHRQINTVIQAAMQGLFGQAVDQVPVVSPLQADNRVGQIGYRGRGNPESVLPRSAISNCFPGLEYDFRNLWRRALVGLVLLENNNYVVAAEDPALADLVGHRLLSVGGRPTMVVTEGPVFPGGDSARLNTTANPNAVSFMEWSNSLAHVLQRQGQMVECVFTAERSVEEVLLSDLEESQVTRRSLQVRRFFDDGSAAFAEGLLQPGELTQGLCAPWQNDYRECACYYWAASRPDFVNVEPGPDGLSRGDMWLQKKRTGEYVPDNRTDSRLWSYDDLFKDWQGELEFIVKGKDATTSDLADTKPYEPDCG